MLSPRLALVASGTALVVLDHGGWSIIPWCLFALSPLICPKVG